LSSAVYKNERVSATVTLEMTKVSRFRNGRDFCV